MSEGGTEIPRLIKLGHELNNIWTGLLGSAEIMQMTLPADAPEHEQITMLLEGIERGEAITQQIRDIAHGREEDPACCQQPACNCIDTSSVSLGNNTLDHDHRQLEKLTLQLIQATSSEERLGIAAQIYHCCLHHFYREEQIMLQCPDYLFRDSHHDCHCALLASLQQLHRRLLDHEDDPEKIRDLADMLPIHILGMDAGMMPYIRAKPELTRFVYTLPSDEMLESYFHLSATHNEHGA